MKRLLAAIVAVSAAVTWAGAAEARPPGAEDASAAGAAQPAGSWGRAIEVPGLGHLNKGGIVEVTSVSCGSAGNCAAGGYYVDRSVHRQGFVAVERHGVWGKAIKVPGLGALNKQNAEVRSVSCGSAGNCAAGGDYGDGHGHMQGFVAVEENSVWRKAIEVPGLGALNRGKVVVWSVSCGSAGNCAAGGDYEDRHANVTGFVAVERHGVWGKAIKVPGLAALNKLGEGGVDSVSCGPAGTCVAGGGYFDSHAGGQVFVAIERNGRWRNAIEVPGLGALNKGGEAEVNSASCGPAGYCAVGGYYTTYSGGVGDEHGFVAAERNGRWAKAIEVPGLAALNKSGFAEVSSVSCASAGNCVAGGYYLDGGLNTQGFAATERNGRWAKAIEVPGLGALNKGGYAEVNSVSCAPEGSCAAGGAYSDSHGHDLGFVAVERNGRWAKAIEVPGLAALNKSGPAEVSSVSCASAGNCAADGDYIDSHHHSQGFVVSRTG